MRCRSRFAGEKCASSPGPRSPTMKSARPSRIGSDERRDVGRVVLQVGVEVDDDVGAHGERLRQTHGKGLGEAAVRAAGGRRGPRRPLSRQLGRSRRSSRRRSRDAASSEKPATWRGSAASACSIVASSLNAGIWMTSFMRNRSCGGASRRDHNRGEREKPEAADRDFRARHPEPPLDPVAAGRNRELEEEAVRRGRGHVLAVQKEPPVGGERLLRRRKPRGLRRVRLDGEPFGLERESPHGPRAVEPEAGQRCRALEDRQIVSRVDAPELRAADLARGPRESALRVERRGVAVLDLGADRPFDARRSGEVPDACQIQRPGRRIEREGIEHEVRSVRAVRRSGPRRRGAAGSERRAGSVRGRLRGRGARRGWGAASSRPRRSASRRRSARAAAGSPACRGRRRLRGGTPDRSRARERRAEPR